MEPDGTHFWLKKGERLSLYDLMCGMMLASGNDAANVVAFHLGGSVSSFMKGVNTYVKGIGCKNTHFTNPHGLHHPDHYTTAYDMAQMARKAIEKPLIMNMVSLEEYHRPKTNAQEAKVVSQRNKLLVKGPFYYEKAHGIKTGYTENAQFTFASMAKDKNRTLIAVLLGCKSSNSRYRDVIKLFDTAFIEKKVTRLLFNQEDNIFSKVVGWSEPKTSSPFGRRY